MKVNHKTGFLCHHELLSSIAVTAASAQARKKTKDTTGVGEPINLYIKDIYGQFLSASFEYSISLPPRHSIVSSSGEGLFCKSPANLTAILAKERSVPHLIESFTGFLPCFTRQPMYNRIDDIHDTA